MRVPLLLFAVLVTLLGGCAERGATPARVEARGQGVFPDDHYRQLLARGQPVFRVDTARSLVVIEVRRGGTLARFGHDHVVASRDLAGYIAPNDGRADMRLPLDTLVVDEPALREQAGLDTTPSAEDIAGTRRNMLEKVLEADRFPAVLIAVNDLGTGAGTRLLRVTVTLHGSTVSVDAAVQVDTSFDEIAASGTLALDQSSFGIAPFSVLGGAITVQDRITMRFTIRARRIT